jgi:hypothetical protein
MRISALLASLVLCLTVALGGCDLTSLLPVSDDSGNSGEDTGGINGGEPAGEPLPEFGTSVTVEVISQSRRDADVLVRFLIGDIEAHRTSLRVPAGTTVTAIGPDLTEDVQVSGTYVEGGSTPDVTWTAGEDFDADDVLEYIIPADANEDLCPSDPNKTAPGVCGCGTADADVDENGVIDCLEDADSDRVPDSMDNCPAIANTDQADVDGDGTGDACDGCPEDSGKVAGGACGCGQPDTDANENGTPDCLDPAVPNDSDGDGIDDERDNCIEKANSDQADKDGDGAGDACDGCPANAAKTKPGACGCETPDVCAANDSTCQDCNGNGRPDQCDIAIEASLDTNTNGQPDECESPVTTRRYVSAKNASCSTCDGRSWVNAYPRLEQALEEAAANSDAVTEIWVAAGTYRPDHGTLDREKSFALVSGVSLYGGFAGNEIVLNQRPTGTTASILSGDLLANDTHYGTSNTGDNSHHVLVAKDVYVPAFDGFTITGGNASESAQDTYGGGLNVRTSTIHLTHCRIVGNRAEYGGGLASRCNGYGYGSSSLYLKNCIIADNTSSGDGGGLWITHADLSAINCVLTGNTATSAGGALYAANQASATLTNCTVSANQAGYYPALYAAQGGASIRLHNCIVWESNSAAMSGAITASYSCLDDDSIDGTQNIASNPLFVDAEGGDFRLQPRSPAIDAGSNEAVLLPYDLDDNNRFVDAPAVADTGNGTAPIVDMGAYEWSPSPLDSDGDGVDDADDGCPSNSSKTEVGVCGCGTPDVCPSDDSSCEDCNENGRPDQCDIAIGASLDANANGQPDECEPTPSTRRYVDWRSTGGNGQSWSTAYTNPQTALAEATANPGSVSEIWVATGVYKPPGNVGDRTRAFTLVDGVSMFGGFAGNETALARRDFRTNRTVLSGDLTGNDEGAATVTNPTLADNSYHVVFAHNASGAVLDGFTITGGNADSGTADQYGGGFQMNGGIVRIANCKFHGNAANYGAAAASHTEVTPPSAALVIRLCEFRGNTAGIDGGAYWAMNTVSTIEGCLIADNQAGRLGGAVFNWFNAQTTLANCTLANDTDPAGLGIWNLGDSQAKTLMLNSILWASGSAYSGTEARYSIVPTGTSGTNNLWADPQFVQPLGDYRLLSTSPAIDAGNTNDMPTATDLDGNIRPVDATAVADTGLGTPPVDIGAYEYVP